jgi:hypothetical protein
LKALGSWSSYKQYQSKDDESLKNLIKQSTQPRGERKGKERKNKERGPESEPEAQLPKVSQLKFKTAATSIRGTR